MKSQFVLAGFLILEVTFGFQNSAMATLTMRQALQTLKENGYKWKQTTLVSREAVAQQMEASSALRPHLQFVSRQLIGRVNQLQYGFSEPGDLNIFTLGDTAVEGTFSLIDRASAERLNAANENLKYSSDTTKQYQLDLTYVMLVQFLNSQRLKRKLDTIRITLERDSTIVKLAQARVDAGVGLVLDLMRAQGLIEVDRVREIDTSTSFIKSCQDFFALLGSSKTREDFPPLAYDEMPLPDQTTAFQKAHASRPDLIASKSLIQVAEHLKLEAERNNSLKISLFGDIGVVGPSVVGGVGNAVTGTFGIQLSIPLIDGSYNDGQIEEAAVKLENIVLQDKQSDLDADNQIKTNLAQLNETKKAVEASKNQITIADTEMKLARRRFLSGATTGLELANAQSSITSATDTNVDATFSYEIAKLNYFKSVGNIEEYLNLQDKVQ